MITLNITTIPINVYPLNWIMLRGLIGNSSGALELNYIDGQYYPLPQEGDHTPHRATVHACYFDSPNQLNFLITAHTSLMKLNNKVVFLSFK